MPPPGSRPAPLPSAAPTRPAQGRLAQAAAAVPTVFGFTSSVVVRVAVAFAAAATSLLLVLAIPLPARAAASAPASTATSSATAVTAAAATESRLLAEMAAQGTNTARLYQLGDTCHDAGVEGDKKAVERAETYLRQLLALEPTHAPALALLGSVYTIKGRDAFWPTAQLRLVREGNAYMDQAIQMAPDNLRARITRAFNNAHMPDFLGRTEIVRADLAWLVDKSGKEPTLFTLGERQEIALHQGRLLKRQRRTEDARKLWQSARDIAPDSTLAAEISAELARLK